MLEVLEHKFFLRMKHYEWASRYFYKRRDWVEHQVCTSKMSEAAYWLAKVQKVKGEM